MNLTDPASDMYQQAQVQPMNYGSLHSPVQNGWVVIWFQKWVRVKNKMSWIKPLSWLIGRIDVDWSLIVQLHVFLCRGCRDSRTLLFTESLQFLFKSNMLWKWSFIPAGWAQINFLELDSISTRKLSSGACGSGRRSAAGWWCTYCCDTWHMTPIGCYMMTYYPLSRSYLSQYSLIPLSAALSATNPPHRLLQPPIIHQLCVCFSPAAKTLHKKYTQLENVFLTKESL